LFFSHKGKKYHLTETEAYQCMDQIDQGTILASQSWRYQVKLVRHTCLLQYVIQTSMIILSVCSALDRAQWPITLPRPIGIGWLYACPIKRSARDCASICLWCPPGLCVDYRLMQPTAYTHRLSTESGPLGGKRIHNPEVRELGPYHYASGLQYVKQWSL